MTTEAEKDAVVDTVREAGKRIIDIINEVPAAEAGTTLGYIAGAVFARPEFDHVDLEELIELQSKAIRTFHGFFRRVRAARDVPGNNRTDH